jgi:thiamine-monophosphate kinase
LCFTASFSQRAEVEALSSRLGLQLSRIGSIVSGHGCKVRAENGNVMNILESGYDHFA